MEQGFEETKSKLILATCKFSLFFSRDFVPGDRQKGRDTQKDTMEYDFFHKRVAIFSGRLKGVGEVNIAKIA